MDEEFDWQQDDETNELVSRFEKLLESGEGHFFDVEEFETIIDYYLDIQQTSLTRSAIEWAQEQHPGSNSFKIREARLFTQEAKYNQALKILDVKEVVELNCEPTGEFSHDPEPLPENLKDIAAKVVSEKADLGIVVDPDVDRLAFVMENGEMFGEEYTLVAVADYVLQHTTGNTVSNLSSTRALRDVTEKAGGKYAAAAVGEVNVVAKMKETGAVIGGEGNGGVIYPELHYGRDALVGTALFLTYLAGCKMKVSELRATYPDYYISKNKIALKSETAVPELFQRVKAACSEFPILDTDGLKIDFPDGWVQLRTSNTEPIMRVYAESISMKKAEAYAEKVMELLK